MSHPLIFNTHADVAIAKGFLLVGPSARFLNPTLINRFSVPHDRLFLDALERDLKREKVGQPPTTETVGEPARSFRWVGLRPFEAISDFSYDPRRSLFEQFAGQNPGLSSSLLVSQVEKVYWAKLRHLALSSMPPRHRH